MKSLVLFRTHCALITCRIDDVRLEVADGESGQELCINNDFVGVIKPGKAGDVLKRVAGDLWGRIFDGTGRTFCDLREYIVGPDDE